MRLVKWYALGLGGLLILTTALAYITKIRHYRQLGDPPFGMSWVHQGAALDVSDLISGWYLPLIGLTFLVGLVAALREHKPSAFSLAPVVLVLVVGAFATFSAIASWYGVVSSSDISPSFAATVALREASRGLGSSVLLGGVLFAVVTIRARRAS